MNKNTNIPNFPRQKHTIELNFIGCSFHNDFFNHVLVEAMLPKFTPPKRKGSSPQSCQDTIESINAAMNSTHESEKLCAKSGNSDCVLRSGLLKRVFP